MLHIHIVIFSYFFLIIIVFCETVFFLLWIWFFNFTCKTSVPMLVKWRILTYFMSLKLFVFGEIIVFLVRFCLIVYFPREFYSTQLVSLVKFGLFTDSLEFLWNHYLFCEIFVILWDFGLFVYFVHKIFAPFCHYCLSFYALEFLWNYFFFGEPTVEILILCVLPIKFPFHSVNFSQISIMYLPLNVFVNIVFCEIIVFWWDFDFSILFP